MRVTVLGTGHVFDIAAAVKDAIRARTPWVVCLELDPARLAALRQREADKRRGVEPRGPVRSDASWTYRMIAKFQERIAKSYEVDVGGEMVAALEAAQELGARVATIDVDSRLLLKRAWREMGLGERLRVGLASVRGMFAPKRSVEAELATFERDPGAYLDTVGAQFPTAKRVLIDERDAFMAREIMRHAPAVDRLVAVVGDGHVGGIEKHLRLLPGLDLEVVRLRHLRDRQVPAPRWPPLAPPGPGNTVQVSFTARVDPGLTAA